MLVKLLNEALPELTFNDLPGTRPWRESPDSLLGSHHSQQKNHQLTNARETPGVLKHSQITPLSSPFLPTVQFTVLPLMPGHPHLPRERTVSSSNLPFAVNSQTRQGFANQPLLLTAFYRLDLSPPITGLDTPRGQENHMNNILTAQERVRRLHPRSNRAALGPARTAGSTCTFSVNKTVLQKGSPSVIQLAAGRSGTISSKIAALLIDFGCQSYI